MRRSSVHSPSVRPKGESALEHVRRISREHNKPFDPTKRGTWRGSSKDLVVNPRYHRNASEVSGGRARFEDLQQGKFYDLDIEREGNQISYGHVKPDKSGDWWGSDYTQGSDYSGGTVCLNNFNQLLKLATELSGEYGEDFYITASGGHGTYAIFWDVNKTPDEIVEVLSSLDDYPSVDDEALSELEMEQSDEAWNDWGSGDFRRELEKKFGGNADEVTDEDLYTCFHEAMETTNSYWEDQSGSGMYVDMKRVVKGVDEPPAGFVVE